MSRDLCGLVKVHVAAQDLAHAVDADVDDDGAGFDHVAPDEPGFADGGDEDVGVPGEAAGDQVRDPEPGNLGEIAVFLLRVFPVRQGQEQNVEVLEGN